MTSHYRHMRGIYSDTDCLLKKLSGNGQPSNPERNEFEERVHQLQKYIREQKEHS